MTETPVSSCVACRTFCRDKFIIREANQDDYRDICSLINNELGYPNVEINDLTSRTEMMNNDKNYRTFVALSDNKVVGFIGTVQGIAFETNGGFIRIIALAVSKKHQNKGIGSYLLKHVEKFAGSIGISAFALNSGFKRLETHAFYEHNGYVKKSYGFSKDIIK